jgi:acetyl esterase
MPLDPGAETVLALIKQIGRPPMHTLTPLEAREASAKSRAVLQPEAEAVAVREELACPGPHGEIRLRHYRPAGSAPGAVLPCLVYFHGGGWVIGDLDSHDQPCRVLCNASGGAVISVDYRMAPEHVYPAAVEDSAAAVGWIAANAARLGIDAGRIAVGGDSAGGNLAAVTALMARDGALPPVGFQLLLYPATDLAVESPAYQRFTDGLILTDKTMRYFIDLYAPDLARRLEWHASPARAASLKGAPTAYVMTAAYDPLVDEGRAYAVRLEQEGVRVTHIHMSDQLHAFLGMGKFIPAATLALRQAGLALAHHWAGG